MEKLVTFLISVNLIITSYGYLTTKPDWLLTCKLSDPEFTKCSTKSVQDIFDHLAVGIKGIEEVDSIDPLKINKIKILQGDGPVSVNASLAKVSVSGFSKMKIVESRVSNKDYSWQTKIFVPKMRVEGLYNMRGRILVIPLNGKGKCWLEPENMNIMLYTKTKLYSKGGLVFYNVTNTKIDYTLTRLKLNFENLFEGVKALEDSTNQYLNNNWEPVAEALKPIIAKTIEDILLNLLQTVFHALPGEYLVSDLPKP